MRRQTPRLASGAVLLIALVVLVVLAFSACAQPSSEEAIPVDNVFTATNAPTVAPSPTPTATPAGSSERARSASSGSGSGSSNGGTQAAPRTAAPRPANVTCPTGSVTAQGTTFAFEEHPIQGSEESNWVVTVKGKATNGTSRQISSATVYVDLRVPNTGGDTGSASVGSLGTGQSGNWELTMQFQTAERPTHDRVAVSVSGWKWGDPTLDRACPR